MISVVVPVYNVEKYIVTCLNSIVKQKERDFELILVNDGSKDRSMDLAQDFLRDKDVTWKIINKENGGLASARNEGIRKAKGEYVVCIDADDAISEDFLSEMLKHMDKDTDFVFCNFQYTKKQESPIDNNKETITFDKENLLNAFLKRTIGFVVPSMLFRRSYLIDNDLFFDEKIRFSEDQPFIWNVILHSTRSIYLYKKMYGYYTRENSIMTGSSAERIIKSHNEFKQVIRSYFADYPEYKNIEEKILPRWELGALYTCARSLDLNDYKTAYKEMNGKTILKRIMGINEMKAYLLAVICSFSSTLMYRFCRRLDLNG